LTVRPDTGGGYRIFTVDSGTTVVLSGLTITHGVADYGGGIFNQGTLTLTNATVSGNSARDRGGGLYNDGTLHLTKGPRSGIPPHGYYYYDDYHYYYYSGFGGGIYIGGGTLTTRNTILAGNTATTGPDLEGSLGSLGHNLIGNTSGGSGFDATDLLDVDPLLGPLQDNGGPTKTMALLARSPAPNPRDPDPLGGADPRGRGGRGRGKTRAD